MSLLVRLSLCFVVALHLASAHPVIQLVEECPAGFTYHEPVNGCYKLVTSNLEWTMAGLTCRSLHPDAHLLVVNNEEEQSAVGEMISAVDQSTLSECFRQTGTSNGVFFWTAGQRIDPSRQSPFVWRIQSTDTYSDHLSLMSYTHWASYQPNYYNNLNQACVNMMSGVSYGWNDDECNHPVCSVCEVDLA